MALSFQCLNYPYKVLEYSSRPWPRRNVVLVVPPSIITPQTEESDSHNALMSSCSSGGPLPAQGNGVGIIGGASIRTTLNFMKKLVKLSSENEEGGVPFVLSSDPALSKALMSYERSFFPVVSGKVVQMNKDPALIIETIRNKRIFLENSGARCIVIPCNLAQSFYDEIAKGSSVPFLHMGECVAKELKEANLKPLETGSNLRIGLVGTTAVLGAGFYQEKLQHEGFEVMFPDKATIDRTIVPAVEALSRKDIQGAQNLFRISLQAILLRAVSSVILASDDMLQVLPPDDPIRKKCIDPVDALARSTIKYVHSTGKIS